MSDPTTTDKPAAAPATETKPDNGLGLTQFIDDMKKSATPTLESKPAEAAPSAPNPDKEMGKEPPKAESKAKPDASPSPDKKAEAKPDPAHELERAQKALKKSNDWAARERKRNDDLAAQLASVQTELQKLNGTYKEPKPRAQEEVARDVAIAERLAASVDAAMAMYGEDEVMKAVLAEDAPYRELDKDPAIAARVVNAKLPVVEAMKVVKEAQTRAKYGNDPEAMRAKLIEELTPELTDKVRKQVLAELTGKKANGVEIPATLGDVRGLSREESAKSAQPGIDAVVKKVFPNFAQTAS